MEAEVGRLSLGLLEVRAEVVEDQRMKHLVVVEVEREEVLMTCLAAVVEELEVVRRSLLAEAG